MQPSQNSCPKAGRTVFKLFGIEASKVSISKRTQTGVSTREDTTDALEDEAGKHP